MCSTVQRRGYEEGPSFTVSRICIFEVLDLIFHVQHCSGSLDTYVLDEFSLHPPLTYVYRYRIHIVRIHNHPCYESELLVQGADSCSSGSFTWIYLK